MGIFGQQPFDIEIEKATSEKNTTEPWNLIMEICDKVSSNPRHAKDCLKAIQKRLSHSDPHVVIQALTVLDACINNCGKTFHLEVASREFENEYKKLLVKAPVPIAQKMKMLIKKWSENDFKNDPELNLIPSFYHKLKSEGHEFSDNQSKQTSKASAAALKDPNVVSSQQEQEDIAKAIELSLKDAKNSPKKQITSSTTNSNPSGTSAYPTLYPSFSGPDAQSSSGAVGGVTAPEPRKVRALYDFEAAEENELTFVAGEIIHVLDDSDPNWWKGYNQRGEGLFPSNFVSADLSVEPERLEVNQKSKKSVQFEDEASGGGKKDDKNSITEHFEALKIEPEINEQKIDRLYHLLNEANPEDPSEDTDEMINLEDEVTLMGPLIDAELERVDRKHAHLTQLSSDLVDAINLYHTLMREPDRSTITGILPPGGINAINFMQMNSAAGGVYNSQQPFPPNHSQMFPGQMQSQQMNFYPPGVSNPSMLRSGAQSIPPQLAMMQQQNTLPVIQSKTPPVSSQNSSQIQQQPIATPQFPQQVIQQSGTFSPHLQQQSQHQIVAPQPQMIPMQYQNGHPNMQNNMQQQQLLHQKQQQLPQQPPQQQQTQPQSQPILQNPQIHPATVNNPNFMQNNTMSSLPPQNFMQGNMIPGQFPVSSQNQLPGQYCLPSQNQPQQQQQQQMLQQNGISNPNTGISHLTNSNMIPGIGAIPTSINGNQQQQIQQGLPLPHSQQFAAINQPITQTILGQNESKSNIPIYQQQR